MKAQFDSAKALTIFGYLGTLVPDSADRYATAFIRACQICGLEPPTKAKLFANQSNKMLSDIIDCLMPKDLSDEQKDELFDMCNIIRDELLADEKLAPGVPEALTALRHDGHELGLLSATRENLSMVLRHHGLDGYFAPEYIAQNTGNGSDPLETKTRQIGDLTSAFQRAHGAGFPVTLIGGSTSGLRAAKQAGVPFIGYASCDAQRDRLREVDPEVKTFRNFSELPRLLSRALVLSNH